MADGSWGYTVSDRARDVGLTVIVTGRPVADEDEDEDEDDNDNDDHDHDHDDDDDDEYRDSDDDAGKQEYMLVGPVGRRRRVVKTGDDDKEEEKEEKEEADGEGAGDSNTVEVTASALSKKRSTGIRSVRGTIWKFTGIRIAMKETWRERTPQETRWKRRPRTR